MFLLTNLKFKTVSSSRAVKAVAICTCMFQVLRHHPLILTRLRYHAPVVDTGDVTAAVKHDVIAQTLNASSVRSLPVRDTRTTSSLTKNAKSAKILSNHCRRHDFSLPLNVSDNIEFECVKTRAIDDLRICIYPTIKDMNVSRNIRNKGGWELNYSKAFMSALNYFPSATFLDIGANIGMHSLVVAKSGRKVVAVEPQTSNILRLHKSVNVNKLEPLYTLIENGVSNMRQNVTLYGNGKNQGGSSVMFEYENAALKENIQTILFDDLLEVFDDKEAVIKMDIEISECRGLVNSSKFFETVNVRAIFMEWDGIRVLLKDEGKRPEEVAIIESVLDTLEARGFRAAQIQQYYEISLKSRLHRQNKIGWPRDVVWVKLP